MAEFDITINGASIKSKVASFSVTFDENSPFNSAQVSLNDDNWFEDIAGSLFGNLANTIPTTPQMEILTGSSSADTSQGKFFVERVSLVEDKTPGATTLNNKIWGRNLLALMDNPFTAQLYFDLSQHFVDNYKMASDIVDYICGLYGIAVYSFDIDDYKIYKDWTIKAYPVDIIRKIAETTDGYVRSTKDGEIWIKKRSYHSWGSSYMTISDGDLAEPRISRNLNYPSEFINRVRFITRGEDYFLNMQVSLSAEHTSLSANGTATTLLTAQITNRNGEAVGDGYAVAWSMDDNYGSLENATTQTKTKTINDEEAEASWFNKVSVQYPISSVNKVLLDGVDYFSGGSFSGSTITLSRDLPYNNSRVTVTYTAKGFAENTLTAGTTPEVSTYVHAMCEGVRDSVEIMFGWPSYSLTLEASKSYCNLDDDETEVALEASITLDGDPAVRIPVKWNTDLGTVIPSSNSTLDSGKINAMLKNTTPGDAEVTATISDGSVEGMSNSTIVYFEGAEGASGTDDDSDIDWETTPSAPSGLSLTVYSDTQIGLTWTVNSDNEYRFRIYRKQGSGGAYEEVGHAGNDETSYIDYSLEPETRYYYKITAYNAYAESGYSNEVSGTTLGDTAAPYAPSGLAVTILASDSVELSWTDNSDNENGFIIESKKSIESDDAWSELATTAPNTTSKKIYNLAVSTLYDFRVAAFNNAGQSAWVEVYGATGSATKTMDILFVNENGMADPDDSSTYNAINTGQIASQTNTKPDMFSIRVVNNSGYTIDASTVKPRLTGGNGIGYVGYFYTVWREGGIGALPADERTPIGNGGVLFATFYWSWEDAGDISYTLTVVDATSEEAIANATVTINGTTKTTDSFGQVTFDGLEAGTTYPVSISATGYLDNDADDDSNNDSITTQSIGDYDYSVKQTAWRVELTGDEW